MIPQGTSKQQLPRPPAFHDMKERHNLLLYLCLLAIAFVFIIASPAQAAGGTGFVLPDQPGLAAPDTIKGECFSPAGGKPLAAVLPHIEIAELSL